MARTHAYAVDLEWTGNRGEGTRTYTGYARDHVIRIAGKPDLLGSADTAFRGDGARHNPEDLLLASLSACHMLWYLHLCAEAGVIVTAYGDRAEGTMVLEPDGGGQFTDVTLRPRVTLGPGSDRALALRLHGDAHAKCFIARSMAFPVSHEPVIDGGV